MNLNPTHCGKKRFNDHHFLHRPYERKIRHSYLNVQLLEKQSPPYSLEHSLGGTGFKNPGEMRVSLIG